MDERRRRYGYAQSPSNLHPIPRCVGERARKAHTCSSLMLCNAKSINNRNAMLQNYIDMQDVDLACMAETWTREGEIVVLKDNYFKPHQVTLSSISPKLRSRGWEVILIQEGFSLRALPVPKITSIDCEPTLDSEESLSGVPSAPVNSLQSLLEAVEGWTLEFYRLQHPR